MAKITNLVQTISKVGSYYAQNHNAKD